MAQGYVGDGKVYSQKVSIHDVAWINADEGQFAPVAEKYNQEQTLGEIAEKKLQEDERRFSKKN